MSLYRAGAGGVHLRARRAREHPDSVRRPHYRHPRTPGHTLTTLNTLSDTYRIHPENARKSG